MYILESYLAKIVVDEWVRTCPRPGVARAGGQVELGNDEKLPARLEHAANFCEKRKEKVTCMI